MRSHINIKYLIQAYNILVLILYTKFMKNLVPMTVLLRFYDDVFCLTLAYFLRHPVSVLPCKYLHNCLKQILEQCIHSCVRLPAASADDRGVVQSHDGDTVATEYNSNKFCIFAVF